jgi:acyl-CoA hydrolase
MVCSPRIFSTPEDCVEAVLAQVGRDVVLGLPVGIGKPNPFVNALVRRALSDKSIHLKIYTALSFRIPKPRAELERRLLDPFLARVFALHTDLEYVRLLESGSLPANIEISEFFLAPGSWLTNATLQQSYTSTNYTHVVRDLLQRGVNVIAQFVAHSPEDDANVSLSCNPDLTIDLLPHIDSLRRKKSAFALVGCIHSELPYMYGDAVIPIGTFDFIVAEPEPPEPLFAPPLQPIGTTDYCIATHVAALVRDGGTIQLGIGELGDAIVYALKLRHESPIEFTHLHESFATSRLNSKLIASEGGMQAFSTGLYGCTEMLVDGFLELYRAGILRRRVYPQALLQKLLNEQLISEAVNEGMLHALADAGLQHVSESEFLALKLCGVFRDDVGYDQGELIAPGGQKLEAVLNSESNRGAIAASCLGEVLRNGVLVHAGFFFGPRSFYAGLRDLPEIERRAFAMQRISFVNELYGEDQALKIAQRRFARFINTTMMVTGLGAAVSDGLADGRVVSGVGGQYNFVAMAHALPDARSILCVRSTRTTAGRTASNIVWNYAHCTIPRHLRDIVVTEYGSADLRGRTDAEVVDALVHIMDARFQESFVADAKRSGKLPHAYRVPDVARRNLPQRLAVMLNSFRLRELFPDLPFGGEWTDEELTLIKALRHVQSQSATLRGRIGLLRDAMKAVPQWTEPYLKRLRLDRPTSMRDRIARRLIAGAVSDLQAQRSFVDG